MGCDPCSAALASTSDLQKNKTGCDRVLYVLVQEYMSCFGGLSPVLSSIGTVLRLHCGRIVCAPSGSGQESYDQYALGPGLGPDGADGDQEGPIDGSQNGLTGEHAHLNGSGVGNAKQVMRGQDRSLMRGRSGKQELQFSSMLALP